MFPSQPETYTKLYQYNVFNNSIYNPLKADNGLRWKTNKNIIFVKVTNMQCKFRMFLGLY